MVWRFIPATLPLPVCFQPQAQGYLSSQVDAGDITQYAHLLLPGPEVQGHWVGSRWGLRDSRPL